MKVSYAWIRRTVSEIALAGVLLTASESRGATVLYTDITPESDILANSSTASNNLQIRSTSTSDNRWVGVSFKTGGAASLEQIGFSLNTVTASAAGDSMTIALVSFNSSSLSGGTSALPYSSSILHSETVSLPASYAAQSYIQFTLDSAWNLAANTNYGIMLYFNSLESSRYITLDTGGSGSTAGPVGYLFYSADGGTSNAVTNGTPLIFYLSSVPEPASCALLLPALATVFIARRKKRTS